MIPSEKFDGDEEAVKELCLANGLSYEKIAQDGGTVTSLEVFFSGFPRMAGLSSFPRLRQLTIVGQSIDSVQALECCPLLSELWVVECQLKNISGLQNCLQLQNLYLYDNQISKIENLELLINLQVLWLNNNDINCIEGMNTLKNLKDLNLADNNIETIGHSLDPNVDLHILNLSGNRIMSFKELTFLAALPHLSVLGLKDPQSSPNPVCLLCNYATHVLYHMPGLQRLDTYEVSSKQVKEAAESTVMKKMMYYNMRVRAAQRSFAETQASLTARKKSLLRFPGERIKTLNHALENLQCELSEVPASDGRSTLTGDPGNRNGFPVDVGCDPTMRNKILRKMEALRERVKLWHRRLEEIESWCEQELSQTANRKESRIRSLLIELETVGNIHFEEVCSTDPGFASYHDLMQSRFSAADYKAHGITGIKINSVIRIHNRALKIRFEDKLHSLLAGEESTFFSQNYKRWLEYLFYVPDPERAVKENETSSIPEEGFVEAEKYKAVGREGAVPLTTSLRLAEGPRMESALRCARRGPDGFPFRHGHVIISKVFLGRSSPVREGAPVDISNYPKAHSVYRLYTVNTENGIETNIERPSSPTMHSGCECSLKQSQWFVFDHELVLPEYIVHFEYISQHHGKRASPDLSSDVDHPYPEDIALDTEALNTEPVPRPRPMMLGLDERTLLEVARANVLSQITVLNLHGTSLNKLKEISRLTALRHLTISFNELTRLDDISHMPNLEFVDASYNHIVTLEGLKGLGGLKQLDLRWNKLSKTRKEVAVLKKHTPALLKLDTRHNDWHRPDTVRMTALNRLTGLTHLDGDLVSEEEVAAAVRINAVSKMNQASLLANSLTDSERPRCLSLLSTAQLLCRLSPAPRHPAGELAPDWAAQITALNLDGQGIHKLTNLEKLINLRWASFNDNDISKLEGLENCLHLEELSLNDNCITKMDGLSKLCCLTKLSLDGNQLSCLEASVLDSLPNLHFLSVENNCIASMNGIQRARTLFELYISNNRITTTRDIYHLKLLTNLVILELYGNPLAEKLENYRIYTVFHLPALKALDGITVEVTESKNAKDVFGGRLTPDMVAEKLGHSNYSDIIDLSLQGSSIRMVDLAPADLFHNLHSVNLEHNSLTSFSGLVYLPNIKALCLNYNHIESILPRQRSQSHLTSRQVLYHRVNSSGYGQPCLPKSNRDAVSTGSLEPLMGSLEVLHLSHNCISNMANLQLSRLSNLKALFLQGNEISQVEGLEGLSRLRKLVLDKNRIKAVGQNSFAAQNILLELHLAENRIRELNHLEPLTELRRLFLGLNKLQDISELVKLEVLPSLTELSVVGNPVARRSLHRPAAVLYLSRLQVLDGMMVTLEERTRAELLCAEPPCPGASVPSVDISAARLLPLVPQNAPPRATGLGAGLQSFLGRDFIFPCILDEAQTHDTSKYKKQKPGSASPRGRAETPLRYIRRTGSGGSPCAGLLPVGNRVIIIYPDLEHGSGFQNGGGARKPSPM